MTFQHDNNQEWIQLHRFYLKGYFLIHFKYFNKFKSFTFSLVYDCFKLFMMLMISC